MRTPYKKKEILILISETGSATKGQKKKHRDHMNEMQGGKK